MDAYYFKEHIEEELEGAKHYMEQAMKCKADAMQWAKAFDEMAMAELEHADKLFKMFNDYYKQFDNRPDLKSYMEPFRSEIVANYMECSANVKYMHEMYGKL